VKGAYLTFSSVDDLDRVATLLEDHIAISSMRIDIVGIRFQSCSDMSIPRDFAVKATQSFPKLDHFEIVECPNRSCLAILDQCSFASIRFVDSTSDALYDLARIPEPAARFKLSVERMMFPAGYVSAAHITKLVLFFVGFSTRDESSSIIWFSDFITRMSETLRVLRITDGYPDSSAVYSRAMETLNERRMPQLKNVTLILECSAEENVRLSQRLATWVDMGIELKFQRNLGRSWFHHDQSSETLRSAHIIPGPIDPCVGQEFIALVFGPEVSREVFLLQGAFSLHALRDVRLCHVSPTDERWHWVLATLACKNKLDELHLYAPSTEADQRDFIAPRDDRSRQSLSFWISQFPFLRRLITNIAVDWVAILEAWKNRRSTEKTCAHLVEVGCIDPQRAVMDLMLNVNYSFVSHFHLIDPSRHPHATAFEIAASLRSAALCWNPEFTSEGW
jgi:hypothetical protein